MMYTGLRLFLCDAIMIKRRTIIVLCIVLVVALIGAIYFRGLTLLQYSLPSPANALQHDANGYTNILLLGVGDATHAGSNLTDTMIVASIDTRNPRSAVLLSIPRDLLLLNNEKIAAGRINALYYEYMSYIRQTKDVSEEEASRQALEALSQEMGRKLAIPIQYYAKVDFTGFTDAIDAVGGIDVVVPKRIVDYSYPLEEGKVGTFEIDAGPQHLDGETALKYARSRHSTTDFDRSARQQQILKALLQKVKQDKIVNSPSKILALWNIFTGHTQTDLQPGELLALARIASGLTLDRMIAMQINFHTGGGDTLPEAGGFVYSPPTALYGSAAVLLPVGLTPDDSDSWRQIRTFANALVYHRSVYLEHPGVVLIRAGATFDATSKLRDELARYGFAIEQEERTTISQPPAVDHSSVCGGKAADAQASAFVAQDTGLPLACPSALIASNEGNVVRIILGKDYAYHPIAEHLVIAPSDSGSVLPVPR